MWVDRWQKYYTPPGILLAAPFYLVTEKTNIFISETFISSESRSNNFVLDVFFNTKFSILSVAHSAAPATSTSLSTVWLHERPYISWWQQWESVCLLCVRSMDSHSEPICTYTQELDIPLPHIKISLFPFASNSHFVIVVSFSNYCNWMFPRALDSSCLSIWKETEGNVSKGTNLQSEKSVS